MNYREAVKAYQGLVKQAEDYNPPDLRPYEESLRQYQAQRDKEDAADAAYQRIIRQQEDMRAMEEANARAAAQNSIPPHETQAAVEAADLENDKRMPDDQYLALADQTFGAPYRKAMTRLGLAPQTPKETVETLKQMTADAKDRELRDRLIRAAGGGVGLGTGATLLSYLLAPKMSIAGRVLTALGATGAGAAGGYYSKELAGYGQSAVDAVRAWLASRAGKMTPQEKSHRDIVTNAAGAMTDRERSKRDATTAAAGAMTDSERAARKNR